NQTAARKFSRSAWFLAMLRLSQLALLLAVGAFFADANNEAPPQQKVSEDGRSKARTLEKKTRKQAQRIKALAKIQKFNAESEKAQLNTLVQKLAVAVEEEQDTKACLVASKKTGIGAFQRKSRQG
ncbi:unnamed protein product, partial [Polarella glacialis]